MGVISKRGDFSYFDCCDLTASEGYRHVHDVYPFLALEDSIFFMSAHMHAISLMKLISHSELEWWVK